MNNEETVYKTALLLVEHFRDCMARDDRGINSRIFSHILHPEKHFITVGQSQEVINGKDTHPEHVVPCATLIEESCRLIKEDVPDTKIAELLTKHWKIANISKDQANYLDTKNGLNLKYAMPEGWSFETGDTYARLKLAGIELLPIT